MVRKLTVLKKAIVATIVDHTNIGQMHKIGYADPTSFKIEKDNELIVQLQHDLAQNTVNVTVNDKVEGLFNALTMQLPECFALKSAPKPVKELITAESNPDEKWKLVQDSLAYIPFRVKLMATEEFEGNPLEQYKSHKRQQHTAKGKGKGKWKESSERDSERANNKSSWSGDSNWWDNQSYGTARHSWQ